MGFGRKVSDQKFFCNPHYEEGFASTAGHHIVTMLRADTGWWCAMPSVWIWNWWSCRETQPLHLFGLTLLECRGRMGITPFVLPVLRASWAQSCSHLLALGSRGVQLCVLMVSGPELLCAALGSGCKLCDDAAWLSLFLLSRQCRCGKAASFWTLVKNTLPSELNFSWFTAWPDFWWPSCLPERKETQPLSHLLPLKPQCYRKEASPNRSSISRPGLCTDQFQRLMLFV